MVFAVVRRIGVNRKTGAWRALVGHKIDGWLLGYQLVVVWMGCIAGGPRMGLKMPSSRENNIQKRR